jgi:feruloyl esterase
MASFNLDRDWAAARRKLSPVLDATDTDLRPFVRAGGKLLMYQGWDDQAVSPYNTLAYYQAADRKLGTLSRDARLFMVPGMGHCFDGNGLTSADFVGEIDHWVETGKAPERIVAEKPVNWLLAVAGVPAKPLMTRPICAYPKAAHYIGKGSTNDEQNFVCR